MNGEPKTSPSNHVEWANGFKSNMPDWPTARRCAHSYLMLQALKQARTALLALDIVGSQDWHHHGRIKYNEFSDALNYVQDAIALANGMDAVKQAFTMPPPPGFPKPPGFK
jgi:hypothetical protein